MAGTTIAEIENYDETVYLIENTDMVMVGAGVVANKSAKNIMRVS